MTIQDCGIAIISAAFFCVQPVLAGAPGFCPMVPAPVAARQENAADQEFHLIDRDRGLVELKEPVRLEPDGLYSESGLVVPWHQIVGGKVEPGLEEQFQSRLKNFGQPLFLLRTRLERGDWGGARISATQIEPHVGADNLNVRSLIRYARFRSSLAGGQPEFAVIPLLELCSEADALAEIRDPLFVRLMQNIDLQQGVSELLVPVWNNRLRAAAAWSAVQEFAGSGSNESQAGFYVYGVSLGIAADDLEGAEKLLKEWNAALAVDQLWKDILVMSLAVGTDQLALAETELNHLLELKRKELSPMQLATADWWISVCRYRQNLALSARTSFREMLGLAGLHQDDWPMIAESALLVARSIAEEQGWVVEPVLIDRELELLRSRRLRYNFPQHR